jgi:hypothetical protein
MTKAPLNYSTSIPAKRTVTECIALLAESGANTVTAQYQARQPVGLSFRLDTPAGRRDFTMPVNIDGVHRLLQAADMGARSAPKWRTRDHAADVAWRVIKDWLEAQLALIGAEMVTLDEVMLPYLAIGEDRAGVPQTLYQAFATGGRLALGGSGE